MKRTIITLIPLDMLLVGYSFLRIPLLEQVISELGVSKLSAGLAFGIYSAAGALGMLLRGRLSDSMDNRKLIILALTGITILGTLVIILFDGSWGFLVGMAISGIGSLGVYPVGYVIITDLVPPRLRGTAYSLRGVINGAGQGLVAAYAILIGVPYGLYAAAMAYVLSLAIFLLLYLLIGSNIRPAPGWRRPKLAYVPKIARENPVDRKLFGFSFFYAIPRGALQVRMITYFVEHRRMTETMASVMLGLLALPAILSFPLVMIIDYAYNEHRVRIRAVAAAVAIVMFSALFMEFFSIQYVRTHELTDDIPRSIYLILKHLVDDPKLRYAYLIGGLAFVIAGTVGPMKNGILADGNLPEYKGVLYASLSIIDSLARGIGASMAGAIGQFYSLDLALRLVPIFRLPSAFVMILIAKDLPKVYQRVSEEIARRLKSGSP